MELFQKYADDGKKDATIISSIKNIISSSYELQSKKKLIEAFIENIDISDNINKQWSKFVQEEANIEFEAIITNQKLKGAECIAIM